MKQRKNFSRKRQAILEAICSTDSHPDAEWVYNKLKKDFPKLSLGTVYRNIAEFKAEGDVASVAVVGGVERIDGNTRSHPHFICNECKRVIDVDVAFSPDNMCKGLEDSCDFVCDRAELVIFGKCQSCKNATENQG